MIDRTSIPALVPLLLLLGVPSPAQDDTPDPAPTEATTESPAEAATPPEVREVEASGTQILIELFTSQGCNYCPNAEKLLQEMATKGYPRSRVIPLSFHVDYFNTPWVDPFSSKISSGRQWAYHEAFKKREPKSPDLYFTPMVMVDGRFPMSGYHSDGTSPLWPSLKARLDRALKSRREASLILRVEASPETPRTRAVTLRSGAKSARMTGRELLACVAVTEDPLTTAVPSGENAGVTLIEHDVVRALLYEEVSLGRDEPTETRFTITLTEEMDPARCTLVAFLQDEQTGAIAQVVAIPWVAPPTTAPR